LLPEAGVNTSPRYRSFQPPRDQLIRTARKLPLGRARLGTFLAITTGGLLALVVSYSPVVAQSSPPTPPTLRVMTWNIQSYLSIGEFRLDECEYSTRIAQRGVSVVALQEVQKRVAERIAHCLGWNFRWIQVSDTDKIPKQGMAILSRYPIIGSRGKGKDWGLPGDY
jgi:hypothetical protein